MVRQDFLQGELLMLAFTVSQATAKRESPRIKLQLLHPDAV
jgi:hypothetical protein